MACQAERAKKAAGQKITALKIEMDQKLQDMQSSKKPRASKLAEYSAAERYALEEHGKVPLHP